ncbi:MAG TPA: aspartate ammonia-lyase [Aggregatilineales bacterium]|nr:aspartate ammonia-lyase [Anaerolineales bacterium]HRE46308.1 aspartate ammonia-lyase [Aggregatilineales bacterium]
MSATRIEKDSLGELHVPADAYYGVQTQRAVNNFPISGLKPYRAFIWSMAAIKRAAAQVNSDLGLLDKKLAEAIMQAAAEVMEGKLNDQFVVDPFQAGAGTSHNMNTNEVIAARANEILGYSLSQDAKEKPVRSNDHVNMAQSTNDTIPTAIRVGSLWRLPDLIASLKGLQDALQAKAVEFDGIVKSGRTHLQDAVPVRLGQEFAAYAKAVERNIEKVKAAAEGLKRLGIGGTATGTGLNAHPEYHARMTAKLSEFVGMPLQTSDDLFESMQSMGDAVFFSAALRNVAQDLTRIANDFRLLSSGPSTGLDEIRLAPVQPGSSIMPGKVNPVLAEMLNMAMFYIMGNDLTVMLAGQAGQLELNVMMPIIAHCLFQSMDVMIGAVNAFSAKCVAKVEANPAKATGWLAKNAILATALNPIIGYEKGAEVVKIAMKENKGIVEVVVEKGYMTREDAEKALDPTALTHGGLTDTPAAG